MLAHLTTVHPRSDTRIFLKQVRALASTGRYSVAFYVQDGKGSGEVEGVSLIDIGPRAPNRLLRATQGAYRMFRAVLKASPEIAHFHDPELIPVGLALKLCGIKVIYDVHEDLPRQILRKHWIPDVVRRPVAWVASFAEWMGALLFDAVVPVTPKIAKRFPPNKTVLVQNFPILDELVVPEPQAYTSRAPVFAYVGGMTRERGILEMLNALDLLPASQDARLELIGAITPTSFEESARSNAGWARVQFNGWADRPTVAKLLGSCRAGLVLFHPIPNHVDAQPNKMFEYMAAGLPVIASDFTLWREIIGSARCGLLVDPMDPQAIADAMQWILDNPEEAEAMGKRGLDAVAKKYNWEAESKKLIALYERLLADERADVKF